MTSQPNPLLPPTLIYGSEMPDIRFRSRGGQHVFFCRRNRNLHLADDDLLHGTYQAGTLLSELCREFCLPKRKHTHAPCPAFVGSYKVGRDENEGLASVELRKVADLAQCAGVAKLLDMTETPEERFLLSSYLDNQMYREAEWRRSLVALWNKHWTHVTDGWDTKSRRGKFDQALWWTLRFPALIPQVWLNWLHSASEEDLKILDEYPSRVDFVAFWNGERHLIEVDGPSHYASYDERVRRYEVDERAYARNLKIARSLQRDGWNLTRIARIEIRDVLEIEDPLFEVFPMLGLLPFHDAQRLERESATDLGLDELDEAEAAVEAAFGDIPF